MNAMSFRRSIRWLVYLLSWKEQPPTELLHARNPER
jgi:hypothetical protein